MVHQQHRQSSITIIERQTKVLKLIDEASTDIDNEISAHKSGRGTCGTISQLKHIRLEIEKMKLIMNPHEFMPYYPRVIVDSWDFTSKLAIKLMNLADEYKKIQT